MHWAKTHRHLAIDLTPSNVLACTLDDLPGARNAVELAGDNDEGYGPLVEAIATRYGVSVDRVATAIGTSGANFLVALALVERRDDVLVEQPAYDPLLAVAGSVGARVLRFERRFEDRYALDPGRVARAMTSSTRLVMLTQPHNPTSGLSDDEAIAEIAAAAARRGAYVLVDEVYLDAARGCGARPAALLADNIISTNSLTKSYGLAGLRCGWAIASPGIAERIRRARDLVDGTGALPAERLSVVAFAHLEPLSERARTVLEPNGRMFREWLANTAQLEGFANRGTVAFPRIRAKEDAGRFCRVLEQRDVGVVPGHFFEAPAHFRIGLGVTPETLRVGLARIAEALLNPENLLTLHPEPFLKPDA
jgi:aspartate/methionine/tyrosine aminotransferase